LAWADQPIPRTHNLEELQAVCAASLGEPAAARLRSLDLSQLTPYAVETRYDAEFWPDRDTAAEACDIAERLMSLVPSWLDER
ncbi:MAG TPA: HEPN domain-containing protein, partial [Burkholderiales bacterium]|nr:HEPN domain-containing protein [Burkholderiales bacterium]